MYAPGIITSDRPMSFIIIDDDKISNLVTKLTLLKKNKTAEIQLFTDPEIALDSIGQSIRHSGDHLKTILILDINMPIMNGWQFLDEFSKFGDTICKQFTIYMFSSSIDRADRERSDQHVLVSQMFNKPLSPLAQQIIWENHNMNAVQKTG